jgi:undecaprenyl-diphosphatase
MISFLLVAFFRNSFNIIDLSINLWSASINRGFFNLAAQIISIVFDTFALVILSLFVAIILFVFHYKRYSVLILGSMAGVTLLVELFKNLIMSSRPLNGLILASGYSFPSGHTVSSMVFLGVLTYFVWKNCYSVKVKALMGGFCISITALVGFDRIYLNVHWFSDIVGSIFLGAFWVTLCILLFKYFVSNGKVQRFLSQDRKSKENNKLQDS